MTFLKKIGKKIFWSHPNFFYPDAKSKNPAMSFCSLPLDLSNDMCHNTVALKFTEIDSFECKW